MKIIKNAVLCLAATTIICGMSINSGCSSTTTPYGIEVSDTTWQEKLSMFKSNLYSATITIKNCSLYSKEQAEDFGEWVDETYIVKIDCNNKVAAGTYKTTNYSSYDKSFTSSESEMYVFSYNNTYYLYNEVIKNTKYEVDLYELTEEDFNKFFGDSIHNSFFINFTNLSNPTNKTDFTYYSTTCTYEKTVNKNIMPYSTTISADVSTIVSLQFFSNNSLSLVYNLCSANSKVKVNEYKITDINNTNISIPNEVYAKANKILK